MFIYFSIFFIKSNKVQEIIDVLAEQQQQHLIFGKCLFKPFRILSHVNKIFFFFFNKGLIYLVYIINIFISLYYQYIYWKYL